MESSRTSNTTTATNTTTSAVTTSTDKPDELVSPGDIRQMSSNQGQHGESVAAVTLQPPNPQQKKCLHHRIFDVTNGNSMNERVAALTNALLHQVNQQNITQASQLIQRPFPLQQSLSQQQTHIIRPHQQMQTYQQYPMQQLPTSIGIQNSMLPAQNGTQFTVGVSNAPTNGSSAASTSGPLIHNQNGLVQQMNAALLAERYLLLDLVEGSTLYKCIDVKTHEELVCKVRIITNIIIAVRLDSLSRFGVDKTALYFESYIATISHKMIAKRHKDRQTQRQRPSSYQR